MAFKIHIILFRNLFATINNLETKQFEIVCLHMMVMVMIFDSVSNPGALPKICRISRSTPRASGPRVDSVL